MIKILFLSGVPIDRTPVIKYTIDTFDNDNNYICNSIELKKSRVLFLINSAFNVLLKRYDAVFFIGIQTLPLLWISQLRSFKLFNWFLESYEGYENNSFILKLKKIELYVNWKNIYAVFPIKERASPYEYCSFKAKIIIPNASKKGNPFIKKYINKQDKIKLVMYGALDNERVYVSELIDFVSKYPKDFHLDLYGYGFQFEDDIKLKNNIFYYGLLAHDKLLLALNDAHYSFIGYRPITFNAKFCAPNKLYEAMSLSLPVILNEKNPTLSGFENIDSIGFLLDFSKLDDTAYNKIINNINYKKFNNNSYGLYQTTYNLDAYINRLKEYLKPIEK